MDPVTAAEIGLDVTSLAFQLFSGCIKGYQLLLDAANMPGELEHVRVRLRLEQVCLLNWGDKVGLLEDVLGEPSVILQLHRDLIFDILLKVSHLFKGCFKIESAFAASATTNTDIQSNYVTQALTNAPARRTEMLRMKALNAFRRSVQVPKRLEWAMVKQDRILKLIEQLISYNNSMLSLLDGASLHQVHDVQMQSQLTLLQLSTKIDDLRQLTRTMQIRPSGDVAVSSAGHKSADIRSSSPQMDDTIDSAGNSNLGRLAAYKADWLTLEHSTASFDEVLIHADDIEIIETNFRIDTALLKGETVWIEWKESDHDYLKPWYEQVIETRVKKLASLLGMQDTPKEFRGPECLGCLYEVEEDIVRYGFVNRIPPTASKTTSPRSLLELLRQEQVPSLSQRIRLAAVLASSLMYLHSVNWLHKGVRSESIIFFPQEGGIVDYDLPVVSGFEFARPDQPGEMTIEPSWTPQKNIYRHPSNIDNPKARSQKSWDIYSLGIVLVEIAAWKLISEVVGIDFRHHTAKSKVRRVRTFLLQDDILNKIGSQCGDRYRQVVKRCLTGGPDIGRNADADESVPEVGSEMMQVFAQDIVGVLQSIQLLKRLCLGGPLKLLGVHYNLE